MQFRRESGELPDGDRDKAGRRTRRSPYVLRPALAQTAHDGDPKVVVRISGTDARDVFHILAIPKPTRFRERKRALVDEVFRLGLTPFLPPEAKKSGFIIAHDNPGFRR